MRGGVADGGLGPRMGKGRVFLVFRSTPKHSREQKKQHPHDGSGCRRAGVDGVDAARRRHGDQCAWRPGERGEEGRQRGRN